MSAPHSMNVWVKNHWWGTVTFGGMPLRRTIRVRWRRLLWLAVGLGLALWLGGTTVLWHHFRKQRRVEGITWFDVAVLPVRYRHIQTAIGEHYLAEARSQLQHGEIARAVFNARSAQVKLPDRVEPRLFLAALFLRCQLPEMAVQALRPGLGRHAADPRFQALLLRAYFAAEQPAELLRLLRGPELGWRLQQRDAGVVPLAVAEVRAVLETEGPEEASRTAAKYPVLDNNPDVAPLLARIDAARGRGDEALGRLRRALAEHPVEALHGALVAQALELGRKDEARAAALAQAAAFPDTVGSLLDLLATHDPQVAENKGFWTETCVRFLVRYRQTPAACIRLADLAARKGWPDLARLLYELELHRSLDGRSFAVYYAASLVKARDFVAAGQVLEDIKPCEMPVAVQSTQQALAIMVEEGRGRAAEARQQLAALRRLCGSDLRQRRQCEIWFNALGFPELARLLVHPPEAAAPSADIPGPTPPPANQP